MSTEIQTNFDLLSLPVAETPQFSEETHSVLIGWDKTENIAKTIELLIPNTGSDIKALSAENWKRLNTAFGLNTREDRVARIDDLRFATTQINSEIKNLKKESEANIELTKMRRSLSSRIGSVTKFRNKIYKEIESSYNVEFEPHYNYNGLFDVDLNPNPEHIAPGDPNLTIDEIIKIPYLDNPPIMDQNVDTEAFPLETPVIEYSDKEINLRPTEVEEKRTLNPEWQEIYEKAISLANNQEVIAFNILNWIKTRRSQAITPEDEKSIIGSINFQLRGLEYDIEKINLQDQNTIVKEIMDILSVPSDEQELLIPEVNPVTSNEFVFESGSVDTHDTDNNQTAGVPLGELNFPIDEVPGNIEGCFEFDLDNTPKDRTFPTPVFRAVKHTRRERFANFLRSKLSPRAYLRKIIN